MIAPVKQIVGAMNSEVAVKFTTTGATVSDSAAAPRFRTTLAMLFAAVALLLAIMGVYTVMSRVTVQRTGECAIRAAMGASPGAILRLVLRGAARLTAIGVVAGAALAVAASRVLTNMLFGLKSTDTLTYASLSSCRQFYWLPCCRHGEHPASIRWRRRATNSGRRSVRAGARSCLAGSASGPILK